MLDHFAGLALKGLIQGRCYNGLESFLESYLRFTLKHILHLFYLFTYLHLNQF